MSVANETKLDAILQARVRVPQGVVYRTFVKETVILNLETGLYHGVNPTGGRMLATLEETDTVQDAAVRLARDYKQPVETIANDLCEFCDALVERGLLQIESA